MKQFACLITLMLFRFELVYAQELITPEDAVAIALQRNYAITISKSELEIAQNNNTLGNAGFMPSLNLNASGSTSDNSFRQNLANGTITERNGVNSNSLNAGAILSWTIFDGFKMFATHEKLQTLNVLSEMDLKVQVENTVASVLLTYYEVVRQKQEQRALSNSIEVYRDRALLAEQKYKIGLASKIEYLQAAVDLNAFRSSYLRQSLLIDNSKVNLNTLLGRAVDTPFEVIDTIAVDKNINFEQLKENALKENTVLQYSQQNTFLAKKSMQEINSLRYPRLALNFGYNYSRSQSEAGFVILNQASGPTAGFTASWTIFNGRTLNNQIRNAHIQMKIANDQLEQAKQLLNSNLYQEWNKAKLAFEILQLEEENAVLARENVLLAMHRYKAGNGTSMELREAQLSFDNAQVRLVAARYEAKQAEIELKKLNGELVVSRQ